MGKIKEAYNKADNELGKTVAKKGWGCLEKLIIGTFVGAAIVGYGGSLFINFNLPPSSPSVNTSGFTDGEQPAATAPSTSTISNCITYSNPGAPNYIVPSNADVISSSPPTAFASTTTDGNFLNASSENDQTTWKAVIEALRAGKLRFLMYCKSVSYSLISFLSDNYTPNH